MLLIFLPAQLLLGSHLLEEVFETIGLILELAKILLQFVEVTRESLPGWPRCEYFWF